MIKYKIVKNQKKKIEIKKAGEYVVDLVGEGAEVEVMGRFRGKGKERHEIEIKINHKAKNTTCRVDIRGVVFDGASAKVVGTIKVYKSAVNTNSFLTEKILMMSDKCRAEAIPNLEIETDEVKCSHAATVSTLDEEQVFYLMSRGFSRKLAEKEIIEGFLK